MHKYTFYTSGKYDRPNGKCCLIITLVGVLQIILYSLFRYALASGNVTLLVVEYFIALLNFIAMDIYYIWYGYRNRLETLQTRAFRGEFFPAFYDADASLSGATIVLLCGIVKFCHDAGAPVPLWSILTGIVIAIILMTIVMLNAGTMKTRISAFFRIMVYDLLAYTALLTILSWGIAEIILR